MFQLRTKGKIGFEQFQTVDDLMKNLDRTAADGYHADVLAWATGYSQEPLEVPNGKFTDVWTKE